MARINRRHWCAARTGGYHGRETAQIAERARIASAPIRHGSPLRRQSWIDAQPAVEFGRLMRWARCGIACSPSSLRCRRCWQRRNPPTRIPPRPVKMLVPYAPGGATDIIARHISPKLHEAFGQRFVVENRPGASGNIALEAAAKAAPDGYTLLVGNVSTNAINENTVRRRTADPPSRDLVGHHQAGRDSARGRGRADLSRQFDRRDDRAGASAIRASSTTPPPASARIRSWTC